MGEAPCSEFEIRRARVVEIARAMLDGRMEIAEGMQELAALQPDVDPGGEDAELRAMGERSTPLESVPRACRALVARYS